MRNEAKKTSLVQTGKTVEPDGPDKPPAEAGCEWRQEPNPNAGGCSFPWYWVQYRIEDAS